MPQLSKRARNNLKSKTGKFGSTYTTKKTLQYRQMNQDFKKEKEIK